MFSKMPQNSPFHIKIQLVLRERAPDPPFHFICIYFSYYRFVYFVYLYFCLLPFYYFCMPIQCLYCDSNKSIFFFLSYIKFNLMHIFLNTSYVSKYWLSLCTNMRDGRWRILSTNDMNVVLRVSEPGQSGTCIGSEQT